jgi:hypothetical protein
MHDKRIGWLTKLKPGDTIHVATSDSEELYSMDILTISTHGRIICDPMTFEADGTKVSKAMGTIFRIVEPTKAVREEWEREKNVARIKSWVIGIGEESDEIVTAVAEVLRKYE